MQALGFSGEIAHGSGRWARRGPEGWRFVNDCRYGNVAGDVEMACDSAACLEVVDVCMLTGRLMWGGRARPCVLRKPCGLSALVSLEVCVQSNQRSPWFFCLTVSVQCLEVCVGRESWPSVLGACEP